MSVRMTWAGIAAVVVGLSAAPVPAVAFAISHDQRFEDFTKYVEDTAARIEGAAEATQKAGDVSLAQQQFLIHDMVKRAAAEVRFLDESALSSPIRDLTKPQIAKVDDFVDWLSRLDYADGTTIAEAMTATHARVDGLLDALAGGKTYPILFGMLARDVMDDPSSAAADIEIYGHDIIDPALGKAPTVKIGGSEIPAKSVSMNGENILIDIPDAVKDAIGFSPTPCRPRNPFTVRVTAFHGDPHGVWPVRWVGLLESTSDFGALPSPRVYEFSVNYNFDLAENTPSTQTFSNRSEYVVAACGQTVATSVRYEAPAGARDLTCAVSWVEASGAKTSTKSCRIAGGAVEGEGDLTGPDRICSPDKVCGCIVNARGWLQIDGSFKKDNVMVLSRTATLPRRYRIAANGSTSIPFELDPGSKLKHVGLLISRRSCPTIHDRLEIQFSGDGQQIMAGVSKSGAFRASYENNLLTVVNATTENADDADNSN